MSQLTKNQTQSDYISRINTVFDYIEKNLGKDISLDELAQVSCFSKYHFSRIFVAMVGETPFEFIKRLRLEKAASLLLIHSEKTVTEISLRCGFNDLAVFSRNFSKTFGTSPSAWRNGSAQKSNHNQTFDISSRYLGSDINKNHNMEQLQSTELRDLKDQTVAYVRHTGAYKGDETLFNQLFEKLFSWAGPNGLLGEHDYAPLAIYHDDPCITEEEDLRLSICLPVPAETTVNGEIGKMHLAGGRFLVARFLIYPKDMPKAWEWIYGSWFPTSGYLPADRLPFEVYPELPYDDKLTVEICIPVTPL